MSIPLTLTIAATTLATTQVGNVQLSAVARWANLSTYFLNVRFIDVTLVPTTIAAAGFLEIAFMRKHLPYDPDSADAPSAAPYSQASLALLPGYQKWNQGNGALKARTYPLNFRMRTSTFTTDAPVLFELFSFASAATTVLAFVRVSFSSLVSGI